MLPLILGGAALAALLFAHKKTAPGAPGTAIPTTAVAPLAPALPPSAPPVLDAHLPPTTQALVQRAATTGTNPANLIAAAQQLLPTAPLSAQALVDRAKAISPAVAQASQAVQQAQNAMRAVGPLVQQARAAIPGLPAIPAIPNVQASLPSIPGGGGLSFLQMVNQAAAPKPPAPGPSFLQMITPRSSGLSGYHLNEPGFYSDQTRINPIWHPQG